MTKAALPALDAPRAWISCIVSQSGCKAEKMVSARKTPGNPWVDSTKACHRCLGASHSDSQATREAEVHSRRSETEAVRPAVHLSGGSNRGARFVHSAVPKIDIVVKRKGSQIAIDDKGCASRFEPPT